MRMPPPYTICRLVHTTCHTFLQTVHDSNISRHITISCFADDQKSHLQLPRMGVWEREKKQSKEKKTKEWRRELTRRLPPRTWRFALPLCDVLLQTGACSLEHVLLLLLSLWAEVKSEARAVTTAARARQWELHKLTGQPWLPRNAGTV